MAQKKLPKPPSHKKGTGGGASGLPIKFKKREGTMGKC